MNKACVTVLQCNITISMYMLPVNSNYIYCPTASTDMCYYDLFWMDWTNRNVLKNCHQTAKL